MIVKCKPTKKDKSPCPMIRFCMARMIDGTITGCGIPLFVAGLIKKEEIMIEHTIRKEVEYEQIH